jgi:hypothetical protein
VKSVVLDVAIVLKDVTGSFTTTFHVKRPTHFPLFVERQRIAGTVRKPACSRDAALSEGKLETEPPHESGRVAAFY